MDAPDIRNGRPCPRPRDSGGRPPAWWRRGTRRRQQKRRTASSRDQSRLISQLELVATVGRLSVAASDTVAHAWRHGRHGPCPRSRDSGGCPLAWQGQLRENPRPLPPQERERGAAGPGAQGTGCSGARPRTRRRRCVLVPVVATVDAAATVVGPPPRTRPRDDGGSPAAGPLPPPRRRPQGDRGDATPSSVVETRMTGRRRVTAGLPPPLTRLRGARWGLNLRGRRRCRRGRRATVGMPQHSFAADAAAAD